MSQRKLQQDIDKLLKKVKEGFVEFEEIYDKFQSTDPENTSYREKLESDLKREIKKLQKHRDQIKTWLSKEDVKDKQSILLENRRLIENGMERFKSVEKLMKTKQFSTEALTNPDIIKDPRELKKRDQLLFVQECLEELQKQLEGHEAQEEQEQVERHEFHIHNLENVLKLLQNNELEPDTVQEYQDDIQYYVENNDDPDFIEYDTIYEDMGCQIKKNQDVSKESSSSTYSSDAAPASANVANMTAVSGIAVSSTAVAATVVAAAATAAGVNTSPNGTVHGMKTLKRQEKQSPKKKNQQASTPGPTVPVVTATTGALSNAGTPSRGTSTPLAHASPTPETLVLGQSNTHNNNNISESNPNNRRKDIVQPPTDMHPPRDRSEEIEAQIHRDLEEQGAFKNVLFSSELKSWLRTKRPLMQPYSEMPERMVAQLESSLLNCPDSLDADSPHFYRKPLSLPHPTSIFFPSEPIRFVCPLDATPGMQRQQSVSATGGQASEITGQEDGKNAEHEEPEDIYSRTSLARILTKFDLDTLFFIFYHYQGTYEQFLAARELAKNRKWMFNKVDRCWYYKEVEKLPPGMAQSEEESWRYFDYQRSWLARRCNSDFVQNEDNFEKIL
ncbi:ZYBA0S04-09384g1_1 [Zygosaccharomyces bailii CLIB 213]|uniref:General negative regulator of transcription subunit n=1 Tax=Zygosaccharomyces bailii (strain CLIB 213 / ATCC 58445 / CBS 680 / BCRC 21525 / NBRC 1098 / NCYC 1416 / NRRL Y-2227) TaxID=1333698 RepID=A0A8J2T7D5_ZYGB2|nr:ZYBA0S04-09384g1_1 [Zygosaccharomyces bailii CLIB 213]